MKHQKWLKVPSVTTGGKPFFWVRVKPEGGILASVAWDRQSEAWRIHSAGVIQPENFASSSFAMLTFEQTLSPGSVVVAR